MLAIFVFQFCYRISGKGTNLRKEPKHIVFLTQLLLLFGFCRSCKEDNPQVDVYQVGTQAVVTTTCSNPKCPKPKDTWQVSSLPVNIVSWGICIQSVQSIFLYGSWLFIHDYFLHIPNSKYFPKIYWYSIMKDTPKEPFGVEITLLIDTPLSLHGLEFPMIFFRVNRLFSRDITELIAAMLVYI